MLWEVGLILLVVLCALSLVWTTVRSGMSPMPSSRAARAAMLEALQDTHGAIADLGSGWGHLALAAARRYPDRQVVGYELSWLPWLVSVLSARILRLHNVRLLRTDGFRALVESDPWPVDTVICYLHGQGMRRLRSVLDAASEAPRWIISNNFALPEAVPEHQWRLRDFHQSPVYRYRWPESAQ